MTKIQKGDNRIDVIRKVVQKINKENASITASRFGMAPRRVTQHNSEFDLMLKEVVDFIDATEYVKVEKDGKPGIKELKF